MYFSSDVLISKRIIDHINKHEGVEWVTFAEMCDIFKSQNKPEAGALMPALPGEILKKQAKTSPAATTATT